MTKKKGGGGPNGIGLVNKADDGSAEVPEAQKLCLGLKG